MLEGSAIKKAEKEEMKGKSRNDQTVRQGGVRGREKISSSSVFLHILPPRFSPLNRTNFPASHSLHSSPALTSTF